jgi:hypothetical protein
MKTPMTSLLALCLLASLTAAADNSESKPETLKTFTTADHTISKDVVVTDDKAWLIESKKAQTIRLFEVPDPGVDDCVVIYRAKLKTKDLKEPAYLEMWCRVSGRGEFFSRGLDNTVTGSNDWASYEIPFFLKKGEKPDLIKLNLVLKGAGKVWVKDVQLLKGPLPEK